MISPKMDFSKIIDGQGKKPEKISDEWNSLLGTFSLSRAALISSQYLHIQVGTLQNLYLCLQLTVLQRTPNFH